MMDVVRLGTCKDGAHLAVGIHGEEEAQWYRNAHPEMNGHK